MLWKQKITFWAADFVAAVAESAVVSLTAATAFMTAVKTKNENETKPRTNRGQRTSVPREQAGMENKQGQNNKHG